MTREEELRVSKKVIDEVKEENTMLLSALKDAYKCSGERKHLTKPVLDTMLEAINKVEM
jgi:hypothetical protein